MVAGQHLFVQTRGHRNGLVLMVNRMVIEIAGSGVSELQKGTIATRPARALLPKPLHRPPQWTKMGCVESCPGEKRHEEASCHLIAACTLNRF